MSNLRRKYGVELDRMIHSYDDTVDTKSLQAHHINGLHSYKINDKSNSPENIALVTEEVHKEITQAYKDFIIGLFPTVISHKYSTNLNAKIAAVVSTCLAENEDISKIFRIETMEYQRFVERLPQQLEYYFHNYIVKHYPVILLSKVLENSKIMV